MKKHLMERIIEAQLDDIDKLKGELIAQKLINASYKGEERARNQATKWKEMYHEAYKQLAKAQSAKSSFHDLALQLDDLDPHNWYLDTISDDLEGAFCVHRKVPGGHPIGAGSSPEQAMQDAINTLKTTRKEAQKDNA